MLLFLHVRVASVCVYTQNQTNLILIYFSRPIVLGLRDRVEGGGQESRQCRGRQENFW